MTDDRLPATLEVTALVRAVQAQGGFAAVIKRGNPDRGAILILVTSRGRHIACFERLLQANGEYQWQPAGPPDSATAQEVQSFLASRTRFDEDLWAVELDVADAQRFIAETIPSG